MAYIECNGGKSAPVLVGTYSGNKTIDVSSYKRASDTVDNFIIETTSIPAKTSTTASGSCYVKMGALNLSKTLSGNNLVVSGMEMNGAFYANGGAWETLKQIASYKVWHI